MKKMFRNVLICAMVALAAFLWGLLRQRQTLASNLVRLHVVANSDSEEDQRIKLQVRDAVLESLSRELENVTDPELAKQYIRENLPRIARAANETLAMLGCPEDARVSLEEMYFDTRHYDTFSLPAGIYQALRITIGAGAGKNWWCVVYPDFCIGADREDFSRKAVEAGLSEPLVKTLEGEETYEIRFFLLEMLGKLGHWLRKG